MMKSSLLVVLACLALALAEPRVPQRGVVHQIQKGVAGPNPYIFLTVPKGRSQAIVQGYEVIEENDNKKSATEQNNDNEEDELVNDKEDMAENDDNADDVDDDNNDDEEEEQSLDDDDDNDDVDNDDEDDLKNLLNNIEEDDDDEDDELDNVMSKNLKLRRSRPQIKNAKATQMMVSREHAGAILVPDEVVEIEGQSVIDEKTGKPALLLPRSVLDSIPDGSVVALMERTVEDQSEERANRVIVRRRRKGARRNIKRRRGGNKRRRVNRRGSNKRRRNTRRKNVRVVRRRNKNGRRGNKRGVNRRRVSYQF